MDVLIPAEHHRRPGIESPAQPPPGPSLSSPGEARAWLDAHLATLSAVAVFTATQGWPSHAVRLSSVVWRYLDNGGHYSEAITIATQAQFAARQTGDLLGQARALNNLGLAVWEQGRYQQATAHLEEAVDLFRLSGNELGEALTLSNLGLVAWQQGHYREATDRNQQAVDALRRTGDRVGEARALGNLGVVSERLGLPRRRPGRSGPHPLAGSPVALSGPHGSPSPDRPGSPGGTRRSAADRERRNRKVMRARQPIGVLWRFIASGDNTEEQRW
jgi:tetratricopeptide (TPR) repeat protein